MKGQNIMNHNVIKFLCGLAVINSFILGGCGSSPTSSTSSYAEQSRTSTTSSSSSRYQKIEHPTPIDGPLIVNKEDDNNQFFIFRWGMKIGDISEAMVNSSEVDQIAHDGSFTGWSFGGNGRVQYNSRFEMYRDQLYQVGLHFPFRTDQYDELKAWVYFMRNRLLFNNDFSGLVTSFKDLEDESIEFPTLDELEYGITDFLWEYDNGITQITFAIMVAPFQGQKVLTPIILGQNKESFVRLMRESNPNYGRQLLFDANGDIYYQ
ncbi:MAG: hypothetical protein LBU84_00525 [Prevotella sp.]|jgi:hypothetical protein|nr:hypothetical protein [Prevotella sp.]